jgi:hypothetical protein
MLDKRLLERMQFLAFGKAFYGHDLAAFVLDGEREARIDAFSIHEHGASAARALVAPFLGSG